MMNIQAKKPYEPSSARTESSTEDGWILCELHWHLVRRNALAARAECADLLRRIGNGDFEPDFNPFAEDGDEEKESDVDVLTACVNRALQFLDDGLIGAAEAEEVGSMIFQKNDQREAYEAALKQGL